MPAAYEVTVIIFKYILLSLFKKKKTTHRGKWKKRFLKLASCYCSVAKLCQASLSFTIPQSLLKLVSIESVMPSNHHILCHSLLPSVFPSINVFSSEFALCFRWPKYWSFIFSISPSNEYSRLISIRLDCFDLAVQGTLKSDKKLGEGSHDWEVQVQLWPQTQLDPGPQAASPGLSWLSLDSSSFFCVGFTFG